MARTVSRPVDRVAERRRAAALARDFRDSEQLSIAEIARRLGRAPATVKAYLYDPTGEKARAVKARYRGTCRSCGAITSPRNGKHDAHVYCHRFRPGAAAPQWTRERVRDAQMRIGPASEHALVPAGQRHRGVAGADPEREHRPRQVVPVDDEPGAPQPSRGQDHQEGRDGRRILNQDHVRLA